MTLHNRTGLGPWLAWALVLCVGGLACSDKAAPEPLNPPSANQAASPNQPPSPAPEAVPPPATAPQPAAAALPAGTPNFADLAARVVPAVVSIQVEQHIRMGGAHGQGGGPGGDPFDFFRFFGQEMPREFENRGLGSGFVIEKEGLILTNQHVVEKADRIEVTFALPDGGQKTLAAKIVGQAPDYDVALIKTEEDAKAEVTVGLGNSDAIRIGDWVMAVGNPFGLDHSVSVGIISAKDRRDVAPSGRKGLYDFLQTDASINPGNSGGPLINLQGQVIGINSAINAQGQGIGFAIPVNMVKDMLPTLRVGGKFVRSWLGIRIQPLTPELAQSYGLDAPRGVLVAEVVPKGPADRGGLKDGDVVLTFEGKKLNRATDLSLLTATAGVGKTVTLVVWRDKQEKSLTVKLEASAVDADADADADAESGARGGRDDNRTGLGLWVAEIPPALRQRLQMSARGGALVENIDPGSAAARAGLARGDVITEVDGATVPHARGFIKQVKGMPSGKVLRLRVTRQGGQTFIALRKP